MTIIEKVTQTLTSADFWQGTAAAVVVALLGLLLKQIWDLLKRVVRADTGFDISGYWIGSCMLPSYSHPQLEIWRYVRKGEEVDLKFFAYDSTAKKPTKWLGGGIVRAKMLSGYYYLQDKYTYESGVMALELSGNGLQGVYAQFDPKHVDEPLFISSTKKGEHYFQLRAPELPLSVRLKMILGRPPFETYAELEKIHSALIEKRKAATAASTTTAASQ